MKWELKYEYYEDKMSQIEAGVLIRATCKLSCENTETMSEESKSPERENSAEISRYAMRSGTGSEGCLSLLLQF